MGNLFLPIIFILASGALFFMYIDPTYKDVGELQKQNERLEEALQKARELQASREELRSRRNNIPPEDLARLGKLLPDNIDNVRLILDMDTIAANHDLIIRDFGFADDAFTQGGGADTSQLPPSANDTSPQSSRDYNSTTLEFSVEATYTDFLKFLRDLEKSLRVVDVIEVDLDAGETRFDNNAYRVKIQTYWLK